jgi:NAD(P)-dependent dehydrogenase (short-subunit alcohol dehydrogenase family)
MTHPFALDFTGKRVLVTGGTRGIGRAISMAYADAGATVAVNGSSQSSVEDALSAMGARFVGVPGSVADGDGCRSIVEQAVESLGGIDILVNNAGIGGGGPIASIAPETFQQIIATNLSGTYLCTKYALPALLESKGNVLNVASVYGIKGAPFGSAYSAAKGGVVNLTRSLAIELAPDVRVNCLCPGGVDTDMLRDLAVRVAGSVEAGYDILKQDAPQKRIAAPIEMAVAALWLTSELASFVTGSIHVVDGGEAA